MNIQGFSLVGNCSRAAATDNCFDFIKNCLVINFQTKMSLENKKQFVLGILIFDDAEVLDFCGPFEVFSTAGYLYDGSFKVITISEKEIIIARNGLKVVPTFVIGNPDLPKLDILMVPGGEQCRNESFVSWSKSIEPSLQYMLSVCTGVSLLGKCGFIDGLVVTTHRMCFDLVQPDCPKSKLCKCQRFTDNGKFLTSAGISAGIDLSLYFVKKQLGSEAAKKVAEYMEYAWADLECQKCTCIFT